MHDCKQRPSRPSSHMGRGQTSCKQSEKREIPWHWHVPAELIKHGREKMVKALTVLLKSLGEQTTVQRIDEITQHTPSPKKKSTASSARTIGPSACWFTPAKSGWRWFKTTSALWLKSCQKSKLASEQARAQLNRLSIVASWQRTWKRDW